MIIWEANGRNSYLFMGMLPIVVVITINTSTRMATNTGFYLRLIITVFKLKYNLPDRVLEKLLNIDHVTISRIVNRISIHLGNLRLPNMDTKTNYYVVDTTTIRVGRGKKKETYSGYKNYHGLKYQVICDSESNIIEVSKGYEASIHDKKIFLKEYKDIKDKLDQELEILGDKAYVGLGKENVKTSMKRNEIRYKKDKIKE